MFDAETRALLRAILNEVCEQVGEYQTATRAHVAAQIRSGRLLADPQELRPLPLAGIPGWHEPHASDVFVRDAPCFRPLRAGRRYPAPCSDLVD